MTPALRCRGVTKGFGQGATRREVLRGVDLEVPRGGLTFLVGPSGSGKSTLLAILVGLLSPTAGEVELLGAAVASAPAARARLRRERLGFVFQQPMLLPGLDAAENAALPLLGAGVARTDALARGRALLARLGLADHAGHRPEQLSGGQQQRVALARALANDPELLVCDEPTSALDAESGLRVAELLREVAREGRAVLVVTHDARLLRFADRVVHLEDGRVARVEA